MVIISAFTVETPQTHKRGLVRNISPKSASFQGYTFDHQTLSV